MQTSSRRSLEGQVALHGWLMEVALARPGRHQVCRTALQGSKWVDGGPERPRTQMGLLHWEVCCSRFSHPYLAEENLGPVAQHLLWVAEPGLHPLPLDAQQHRTNL